MPDSPIVRIKVQTPTHLIEIEAPNEVLDSALQHVQEALAFLPEPRSAPSQGNDHPAPPLRSAQSTVGELSPETIPQSFGEFLHMFPSEITNNDRMVIAGTFLQRDSPDSPFSAVDAANLLKPQGFKIHNPTNVLQRCALKKHVFQDQGAWRVAAGGWTHLQQLIQGGT